MLFFSYLITITKVQQLFIIANTITNDTKDAQTFPYSWVLRYHIIRHHKDNSFLNILVYIHFKNYFHLWASQLWWWKGNGSFYFQKSSHSFLCIFCHIVYNVQCDTMTWIFFLSFIVISWGDMTVFHSSLLCLSFHTRLCTVWCLITAISAGDFAHSSTWKWKSLNLTSCKFSTFKVLWFFCLFSCIISYPFSHFHLFFSLLSSSEKCLLLPFWGLLLYTQLSFTIISSGFLSNNYFILLFFLNLKMLVIHEVNFVRNDPLIWCIFTILVAQISGLLYN